MFLNAYLAHEKHEKWSFFIVSFPYSAFGKHLETSWVSYKKLGQQCVLFLIGGWSIGDILLLIKEHKLCYLNNSKG